MSDKGIFTGHNEDEEWSTCFISSVLRKKYMIREGYRRNPILVLWDRDTLIAPECLGVWKNT